MLGKMHSVGLELVALGACMGWELLHYPLGLQYIVILDKAQSLSSETEGK